MQCLSTLRRKIIEITARRTFTLTSMITMSAQAEPRAPIIGNITRNYTYRPDNPLVKHGIMYAPRNRCFITRHGTVTTPQ